MPRRYLRLILSLFVCSFTLSSADRGLFKSGDIVKTVLDNGLTILVKEAHDVPHVYVQMWYNVGSKDELSHERGKAHMLEHMVFKGTKNLSETDIQSVVNKLSGYCNAVTSYDYTHYDFMFPSQHWQHALILLADCMRNCTFKDDLINSEMKAVIQELKMGKDSYSRVLLQHMLAAIFEDHPYHFPVIGYKQDLWNMNSESLHSFYSKHYVPNNAVLVVVGDVQAAKVCEFAQKCFGGIAKEPAYKKNVAYCNRDTCGKSVVLHKDISQPSASVAWVVPGISECKDYPLIVISHVLGGGRSSRLYRILVEEQKLALSVGAGLVSLFDHSLFMIRFEPKRVEDIDRIINIILAEIETLKEDGPDDLELKRVATVVRKDYCDVLESYDIQADLIGKYYLATQDEYYIFRLLDYPFDSLKSDIASLLRNNFIPSVMHRGTILPLGDADKEYWHTLQQHSDQEDHDILSARVRESLVEVPAYAHSVQPKETQPFDFPKSHNFTLSNGVKVFSYKRSEVPKIDMTITFKARGHVYDPVDKQGLYNFMSALMLEGSQNYTAQQLADLCELHGISISCGTGSIHVSCLSESFDTALDLVYEICTKALFREESIEKVRDRIFADIQIQSDDAYSIGQQLAREAIFANHPFAQKDIGDKESIELITQKDIVDFYKKIISPDGMRIAVVGDIDEQSLNRSLERVLGDWKGSSVELYKKVECQAVTPETMTHFLARDQIFLMFSGLSVKRAHEDYDKLVIFNHILSSGLDCRLFKLREQTGLFYTASGAAVSTVLPGDEPGVCFLNTIVSKDRLDEARTLLSHEIDHAIDTVDQEEFEHAKRNVIQRMINQFTTNGGIAQSFLFLDDQGFNENYFEDRIEKLQLITLEQMKLAVKKIFSTDAMVTVIVGRI